MVLEFKLPFPFYVSLKYLGMYENRPFLLSRQDCRTQVVSNKLSLLKIPFFSPNTFKSQFFIRKNKFSNSHEAMYPFGTICMNGLNREKVNLPNMPNFSKGWMSLLWELICWERGLGKAGWGWAIASHMRWGHTEFVVFTCTWPNAFCVKATKASNHCGGDHAASDLLVCLLNVPLREHEKREITY